MNNNNNELLARLLATFRIEADEHVRAMSSALLVLEKLSLENVSAGDSRRQEIVETIFRQAHSLKGAARAVKFNQVEALCQPLESIFAALRDRELSLSTTLADLLHRAVSLIETLASGTIEQAREKQSEVTALVRQLERPLSRGTRSSGRDGIHAAASVTSNNVAPNSAAPDNIVPDEAVPKKTASDPGVAEEAGAYPEARRAPPTTSTATTVRVSTQKLDAVMRLSEGMLASRLAAAQRAVDIREVANELTTWRKRSKEVQHLLRPLEQELSSGASEQLRKLLGYFADEQVRVHALEDQLAAISRAADSDRRALASMTDDLQQRVRDMQLLPCTTLLELFARQARTLAREQGKEVDLTIHGSDIEVDRRLLDEIKDPLIHLVRNCVDHGIEKPAERRQANKTPQGNISISVRQKDSGKIVITITDDGAGIDVSRLKAIAVERNVLTADEAAQLPDTESLHLIFKSGLSTSRLITDLSGRGLGMAIVRDKIEQLGGTIDISSATNLGTRFELVLPISLATFRGTLVQADDKTFIVPSANVDRVQRVPLASVHNVNNSHTVGIDGQALALVWLHDVLQLPRKPAEQSASLLTMVLGRGIHRVVFSVDSVLGEQEVLVKGLGPQLRKVPNIAGASILGDGQVVPVLNVPDLLEAASRQPSASSAIVPSGPTTPNTRVQQSILVAEDSITSRSLMKNILEAAGYLVVTAVDGIDAYTTLKTQHFDLVVSDVDMPRMNGFDLTAKLRANQDFSDLPVILVTTLDSREDRERGVDAGANAYIVKSSFDQSNLLEVIERLI